MSCDRLDSPSPRKTKPDSPLKTFKPCNTLFASLPPAVRATSSATNIVPSIHNFHLEENTSIHNLASTRLYSYSESVTTVAAAAEMDENMNPDNKQQAPLKPTLSKTERSIFNVPKRGTARPEHHHNPPSRNASSDFKGWPSSAAGNPLVSGGGANRIAQPAAAPKLHDGSTWSHLSSLFGDKHGAGSSAAGSGGRPVASHVIQRITNAVPARNMHSQAVFSSQGGPGFQPISVPASTDAQLYGREKARQDLDSDDEEFDPDAGLREELGSGRFGAPDVYGYVDPEQANKNLKELLSGAFEEDELNEDGSQKKRRLPRVVKSKVLDTAKSKAKTLAQKLHIVEQSEADKKKEEEKKHEAEADGEDEEDDGTVDGLAVKLLPHQIDGVAWMVEREVGRSKKGVIPMGGILADDMGLGKTIQAMALILMNPRPSDDELAAVKKTKKTRVSLKSCRTTLVVAPVALIRQWESEIKTKSEHLTVHVHHGASRTTSAKKLMESDVVVTTYSTVMSEFKGGSGVLFNVHWFRVILDEAHTIKNRYAKTTQACYGFDSVYRWCLTGTPIQNNLDELQSLIAFLRIKPYNDPRHWKSHITDPIKTGRGHVAMQRVRWFLKACMKRRTKDILKKEGALGKAVAQGDGADAAVTAAFQVVEREVRTLEISLSPAEQRFYDNLEGRLKTSLEELMDENNSYMGAFVLLLRLRQACNHPYLMKFKMEKDRDALMVGSKTTNKPKQGEEDVDDLADLLGTLSVKQQKCDVCKSALTKEEVARGYIRCGDCEADLDLGKESDSETEQAAASDKASGKASAKKMSAAERNKLRTARQRKMIVDSDDEDGGEWLTKDRSARDGHVGTDDEDEERGGDWIGDSDSNTEDEDEDGVKDEDESQDDLDASSILLDNPRFDPRKHAIREGASFPSTKINRVLHILRKETPSHKTIVFSVFTTMLDIMEPFLRAAGFRYVRYDGSMRNDAREESLRALREDSKVRVLLCSLKCGALGLNLTAASRVVIMEPFWNPFVEEQAIGRVHRLNQTRDVVVYRLTIRGSVEERILEMQEAKRNLAASALDSTGVAGAAKLTMQDIMALFRMDAGGHHGQHGGEGNGVFEQVRVLDGMRVNTSAAVDDAATKLMRKEVRDRHKILGDWDGKKRLDENGAYGRR